MMKYKTTIGLEIHVQLKTKSKMFCGCDNNAENAVPNTLVCPVCLGLPGVLPVANRQAIEWTLKTGLALGAEIAVSSRFDRKHYFYPDLPKNYQISQYDLPFCEKGFLEIETPSRSKKINLKRIHLEEDAGKLIHTKEAALVDFNRAGTPLMEIVTEPEINSASEAKIFIQELRAILRYLKVSEADMEKGHLRCDANISVCKFQNPNDKFQLGTPVEIKNLNSFRMVERALLYEEKRQKELLEKGEEIVKETRGWNENLEETYSQRSKEFAFDYRYFPEPDIPPFEKNVFDLEKIKAEIPELPALKRKRYLQNFGLSSQDAAFISLDQGMADYFEQVSSEINPKVAANWLINELKMDGIRVVSPEKMIEMLKMLENGEISGKIGKEILAEMKNTNKNAREIIEEKGLAQVGDEEELAKIVEQVLKDNPQAISDFKKGKKEVLGFLVGMVMRQTRGKANPMIVNKILEEKLKGG